jgi:hypothetical protein
MQLMSPFDLVFISGPYRAEKPEDVLYNVRVATSAGSALLKAGYSVICPHSMTHEWDIKYDIPDDVFLRNGIVQLSKCDAMLVLPGWENSEGTKAEIAFANNYKNNIPVFYEIEDLLTIAEQHRIE